MYIKSCQSGESTKKAETFSYHELEGFVNNQNYSSKYWLVRKAMIALAFFGAHRVCELRGLNIENLTVRPDGVLVKFKRAKQREELKVLIHRVLYNKVVFR
jgi:site-specific recombinase XerD